MIKKGDRVGRLIVGEVAFKKRSSSHPSNTYIYRICKCDCGNVVDVREDALVAKKRPTKSCGCIVRKHSLSHTPEYVAWKHALSRCLNKQNAEYHNYGGRGITMFSDWVNDVSAFIKHIGLKPSKKHWLERIDNNKGYEPGNVKWSTVSENLLNRRRTFAIENYSNEILIAECKRRGIM